MEDSISVVELLKEIENRKNFLDKIFPHGIFSYNPRYAILHPWIIIRDISDEIKFAYQRVFRGWDDRTTWGLDTFLNENMPLWLNKIRQNKNGVPSIMFSDDEICENDGTISDEVLQKRDKQYDSVLEEIMVGFDCRYLMDNIRYSNSYLGEYEVYRMAFERSLELLKIFYGTLYT